MLIPRTTHEKRKEDAMRNYASGQSEMRMVGDTYIKPTAVLEVTWAYRNGEMDDKGGEGGVGSPGENGGES
jgi:hypothetical protein